MARSCTTTAHRWSFEGSPSSLRNLWYAVIKLPNCSDRRTASPMRLLHGALVILVRKQTSQFRSRRKWVSTLCFLSATFVRRSESESWEMCAGASTSVSSRFSVNSSRNRSSEARLTVLHSIFVSSLWWIAPVSWCGFVTSLWCQTWRCTWRVLRWSSDNKKYEVVRFTWNCLPYSGQPWFFEFS